MDKEPSCIIEDTPQFAETAGSSKSRAPSVRANVTQTILLKKAYEEANVLSFGQAELLAEEIGLPVKWILQWFGRQRTKERKNDINYMPRLKGSLKGASVTASPDPAAGFFSDSGSGASATGNVSAQEIMSIKSEHGSSTPSVSGSTSVEEFTPFPTSESPAEPPPDVVAPGLTFSGTRKKKAPKNRKASHAGYRLKLASPNAQTGNGGFGLLAPGETSYGPNLSDDAQFAMTEPDMNAYTQLSSPLTSHERYAFTPAPQSYLPRIVPPRRSPIVTSDNAIRSAASGREVKTRHGPSRLSVVNMPMDESDVSLHQEAFFHQNLAFSLFQAQWYNNRLSMAAPWDRAVIAPDPVLYSQYLVPTAGNPLSNTDPPFTSWPDFVELDFAVDGFTEAVRADFADLESSFLQENELTCIGSVSPERYCRQTPHPSTNVGYYTSAFDPDHLEALDPSRAPLKHLTGMLTEYEAEDGTYLSLLVGLQDPARRSKIIGCLSNEELVSHDPFAAAMGLALLSRLGVL